MNALLGAIPAPPGNAIHLGPLQIRAYSFMIAIGVFAGVSFAARRWQARGGNRSDVTAIATWAVPAGLVGARIYHVLLAVERRGRLGTGRLFALYVGGYALGRLWVEALRIDHANTILGLRVNTWTSLIAITGVALVLIGDRTRRPPPSTAPGREGELVDHGHHRSGR